MTPEELTQLVERGDTSALVELMSGLDERQRKALSATAQQLFRKHKDPDKSPPICVQLAVMGTGPLSVVEKCSGTGDDDYCSALSRVLIDRRPHWLTEWIDSKLAQWSWQIEWEVILPLVESGCVSPATSDGVVKSMVCGLHFKHGSNDGETAIGDDLVGQTELLEGVYRVFEIETDAFDCYAGDQDHVGSSWPRTIIDLCEKGHLDRSRILAKSVHGLSNDFKPQTINGIARFHDDLAPTDGERKRLEEEYLALLACPATSVVGFAMRHLKALAKAKQLDADAYVRAVPRVFQCSAKSHPKTALILLKSVVKQQPGLRSAAVLAAAEGLVHPHEDVQDSAMQLVETWAEPGDFQLSETLAAHRDQVAAPIQPRLDAVLAKLGASADGDSQSVSAEAPEAATLAPDWASEVEARRTEINQLPQQIRQKLGLDVVLAACEQNRLAPAATWTLFDAPLLSSLERIEPIQSLDELFDAVAHAIETVDHGDDVERIMDAVSRMCDQRPAEFERRAAPIVARIRQMLDGSTQGLLAAASDRGVVRVLMAWLTGSAHVAQLSSGTVHYPRNTWRQSMVRRMRALAQRVEKRVAAPLLAAPTHRGGWIEPAVWAERWECLTRANVEVPEIELIQSLLRLTPDGREAALGRVKQIESPFRHAIVWALGGEGEAQAKRAFSGGVWGWLRAVSPGATQQSAAVWIAAVRCRDPEIRLTVKAWPHAKLAGPDVLEPASYRWKTFKGAYRYGFSGGKLHVSFDPEGNDPIIEFELQPSLESFDDQHLLTAMSHAIDPGADDGSHPKWLIHWSAMLWPAKLDGYWRSAVTAFLGRIEKKPTTLAPHAAYLDALFEPDRPLTELAALALWIATLSKDADSRTAAIDAWIELVADGRGDARLLGRVLVRLREGGWLRLNRLADALREVSRVSPLHAWTVAEVLQDLLASQKELPRDGHHLLQLLREVLVQLGLEIRAELRSNLELQKGGGKTAKLARQLATLTRTERADQHSAVLQLLDARIARANRWSPSLHYHSEGQ